MKERRRYIFSIFALVGMWGLLTVSLAHAVLIGPKGPDIFGYSGNDISFNLRDISSSGTPIPLGDEVMSSAINIGFDFGFYGISFSQLYVSDNGFLDFDGGNPSINLPEAIPGGPSADGGIIGGLLGDHNTGLGSVRYETVGAVGSREFVVGFYNVPRWPQGALSTFEIILHETTNEIEFQYAAIGLRVDETSAGLESPDGTDGLALLFGSQPMPDSGYLLSVPEPSTLPCVALGLVGISFRRRMRG